MTDYDNSKANNSLDITLDLTEYVHYLDGLGLSEEEALICLNELCEVAQQMIYFGFRIHPIQQAQGTCGEHPETLEKLTVSDQKTVSLLGQFIEENITDIAPPENNGLGKEAQYD